MTVDPGARPPSPWARFVRPSATEPARDAFTFGPPRPLVADATASRGGAVPVGRPLGSVSPPASNPGAPERNAAGQQIWAPHPPVGSASGVPTAVPTTAPAAEPAAAAAAAAAPALGSYFFPFPDDEWADPRPTPSDEGRGLAIAAVVFGLFFAPLGLVFGLVAAARARRAEASATLAVVGIVVASVMIVAGLVYGIAALDHYSRLASVCARLGAGEYVNEDGQSVVCD